ncbi:helix-turn-helix domain-containing protein [Psychroserpens sp. MEBiC05023]
MKLAVNFILITGIVLNSIAIINLFRVKKRTLPQNILIVFWIFILGVIVYFYAALNELNTLAFIAYYFERGIRFVVPPLMFLYVNSIFRKSPKLVKQHLFHFIPFFLFLIFYIIPQSVNLNLGYLNVINKNFLNLVIVQNLYGIGYFLFSLKLYYSVSKKLKHSLSTISDSNFLWLQKFLISFLCVLFIDLFLTISEVSIGYNINWDSYVTVFFLIVAIGYIGYYGLTQSTIFLPNFLIEEFDTTISNKQFYLKENLKDELKEKFNTLMSEEKIYLQSNLNLKMLADQMMISERQLSAFFNEVLQSNFYDTINSYRVEEVKMKLKTDAVHSHSITGIGLSSGFSSKSSFYRVFKKATGLSPSAYIKESHDSQ